MVFIVNSRPHGAPAAIDASLGSDVRGATCDAWMAGVWTHPDRAWRSKVAPLPIQKTSPRGRSREGNPGTISIQFR